MTEIYNAYLKLNGGSIDRSNNRDSAPVHISNIDENTLLINLISHDSGDIAKTDWIYIVVMDIVSYIMNALLNQHTTYYSASKIFVDCVLMLYIHAPKKVML